MSIRVSSIAAALVFIAVVSARALEGRADLVSTAEGSKAIGTLTLSETPAGLQVKGRLSALPPGDHGFHIHEFGACGDAGKAAGAHYNPDQTPHGHVLKDGPAKAHAGDMGNLAVDASGSAEVSLFLPGMRLSGASRAVAGRAFIVHEKKDDFSQPLGNAGGRIACGAIVITGN